MSPEAIYREAAQQGTRLTRVPSHSVVRWLTRPLDGFVTEFPDPPIYTTLTEAGEAMADPKRADAPERRKRPRPLPHRGPDVFERLLTANQLPVPEREYRFHPTRKWRFDFAWPEYRLYLEVEGGVWMNGRHTRGSGFVKDIEKYNAATILGWRPLKVTPRGLNSLDTVQLIRDALSQKVSA